MPEENEEEAAGVPTQHRSAFVAFLQQLASFTGDLSQITAPTFLLNGVSLLEYSTHWGDHPQLLSKVDVDDPVERMKEAGRWFVSTLFGSYHERCKDGSEKKPYNPILGEQFFCEWHDEENEGWNEAKIIVEQVSHHPPISAFHVTLPTKKIEVTGHCGQKSKFKGMTVKVEQTGRAKLVVGKKDSILISLPELVIRGILSGNIFLELSGACKLVSTSGYACLIEFQPKPWFSGSYHNIKGSIYKEGNEPEPFYTLSGKWTEQVMVKDRKGNEQVFFDVQTFKRPKKQIKHLADQTELESRLVWKKVTEALDKGEYGVAGKEKNEVEERQRELRKERADNGEIWEPKFFEFVSDDGQKGHAINLLKRSSSQISLKNIDNGYYRFKK